MSCHKISNVRKYMTLTAFVVFTTRKKHSYLFVASEFVSGWVRPGYQRRLDRIVFTSLFRASIWYNP